MYTVSIINESAARQRFVLYHASPFSGDVDGFGNVWMDVTVNEGGDTQNLRLSAESFAWAGTTETPLQSGVVVCSGKSLPAALGGGETRGATFYTTVVGNSVNLQEDDGGAPKGAYQIKTLDDFDVGDTKVLIGLSKEKNGRPVPVASLNPLPNTVYNVTPVLKAVITVNNSSPVGEALTYQAISDFPGIVDFSAGSGLGKFTAVVIFTSRGGFEVDYV
ncbi:hypothetical protein CDD83_1747 [Cordyceps sp. RAO-2017]|nr:hypothetical protein CDD83_1747 [Cordyceps sp. RAO-2017]